MLKIFFILLLFSNAVTLRRDKSIIENIIVITVLLLTSFLAYANLYVRPLENGIGIYGGLFNVSTYLQTFNIFIFFTCAIILILTTVYAVKIKTSFLFLFSNTLFETLTVKPENIVISNYLSSIISIITLLLLFIYMPEQWFSIVSILTYLAFNRHEI